LRISEFSSPRAISLEFKPVVLRVGGPKPVSTQIVQGVNAPFNGDDRGYFFIALCSSPFSQPTSSFAPLKRTPRPVFPFQILPYELNL